MKKYRKQWFSGLLAASVLFSALPVNALAVEIQDAGGLCEHHPEHTSTCGYVNDVPGTPCNHEHTEYQGIPNLMPLQNLKGKNPVTGPKTYAFPYHHLFLASTTGNEAWISAIAHADKHQL